MACNKLVIGGSLYTCYNNYTPEQSRIRPPLVVMKPPNAIFLLVAPPLCTIVRNIFIICLIVHNQPTIDEIKRITCSFKRMRDHFQYTSLAQRRDLIKGVPRINTTGDTKPKGEVITLNQSRPEVMLFYDTKVWQRLLTSKR